jgi:uncharacterized RDD family membrane protein YckC
MRYLAAAAACLVLVAVYVIIGGALGWKNHNGGVLPLLILCGAMVFAWRAITKTPAK